MIGVDWGTSNFRAWLMDADARPLETVTSGEGLLHVPGRDFASALRRACGPWLDRWPHLPVLMCGMVGSRHGWREVPYLQGAATAGDLARATLPVAAGGIDARIVPGLQGTSLSGAPDVMRGEETQLSGAITLGAHRDAVVCLPGTHSKWVNLRDGHVRSITTFLTGELFALLRERSILTGLIEAEGPVPPDMAAAGFRSGLTLGQRGGGLTHKLFSLRAAALTGAGSGATAELLSGLLIGCELAELGTALVGRKTVIIASGAIASRYRDALGAAGHAVDLMDADATCRAGLAAIAREVAAWSIPDLRATA